MGAYVKQTVANGQTITSTWGNDVQTQFEEVVGTVNNEITEIKALFLETDTRSVNVQTRNAAGKITQFLVKDGGTTVATINLTRDSANVITSFNVVANGKTVTYTVNRTNGVLTSITKTVV